MTVQVALVSFLLGHGALAAQLGGFADTTHPSQGEEQTQKSAHFVVRWEKGLASPSEVQAVATRAEAALARFGQLLPKTRMPKAPLRIRLAGDGSLEQHRVSSVDPDSGELVLFRNHGAGYEESLAHELVHALRWRLWTDPRRQTDAFLFWEEGFAEALADEAGFPSAFPGYGYPPFVVGQAWISTHEELPLPALVRHHRALNFRCMAQAYGERWSFMRFLREKKGFEKLVQLAYADGPSLAPKDVEVALGGTLEELSAEWHAWTARKTQGLPEGAKKLVAYRKQTPIQYFPVCGTDVVPADSGP